MAKQGYIQGSVIAKYIRSDPITRCDICTGTNPCSKCKPKVERKQSNQESKLSLPTINERSFTNRRKKILKAVFG